MSISLPPLRYAAATARLGSFTQAAAACGVSQPTVSNAVAQLEESLGGQLFVRTTRKLSLTEFGEFVMPLIVAVVEAQEELVREAAVFHDPPEKLIRVGFSPLIGANLVARLIEPFTHQVENLEIVFKECGIDDMEARLDSHRIDVVFTPKLERKSRRRSVVFRREPLHYVPRGGSGAITDLRWRQAIPLETIVEEQLMFTKGNCGLSTETRDLFRARGLSIREYRGEAISYTVLEEWADLGIGGAILPAAALSREPSAYPQVLDGGEPAILEYRAVWNHDTLRPSHLKQFVHYLRTTMPKLLEGEARTAG